MACLNGTCIAIDGHGVLIRGPSGAGKSDLALRLIDRGAQLVSDDYCDTVTQNGALIATAPATIANKIEVRGYGIVNLPAAKSAPISLVVDLMPEDEIERMPDSRTVEVNGVPLRHLVVDARAPSAAAKVRLALRTDAIED